MGKLAGHVLRGLDHVLFVLSQNAAHFAAAAF